MAKTIDVAELIGSRRLGAFHLRIILLCLCVQFLDGFDQQALAYAAPALRTAWGIGTADLGRVFGYTAFGTGIGSVVLGPLADVFGRKKIIIAAVSIFGALTLCTVFLTSIDQLLILRPMTGFGLGAALPLTFVMANEFAPTAIRARMVAAMACGFAIGAATGGLLQAEMLPLFGWQGIFAIGGILPLLLAFALAAYLPESVRFLAARGGSDTRIAKILRNLDPKLAFDQDTQFAVPAEPKRTGFRPFQLFTENRAAMTLLLWLAYLVLLASLNTLNNFLPTALAKAGLEQGQALRITTLFQFGGIAGVLILGAIADRLGYRRVIASALVLLACFIAATGSVGGAAIPLAIAVAGTGFFLVGANNTLTAFATTLYPTDIRSTGVTWAGSFGRFLSGFGPIAGGILLERLPLQPVFFIFAMPALIGALAVISLSQARVAKAA